jgi:glycine cleavage system H protein
MYIQSFNVNYFVMTKMFKNIAILKTDEKETLKNYHVQCEGRKVCVKTNRDYTKTHMWIKNTIEGNQKIGVTDYAQQHLREKVGLVEIFKNTTVGEEVEVGEVFGTIYGRPCANLDEMRCEYVAFDLIAPISGKIVEINQQIMETPYLINSSPYNDGWIVTVAPRANSDLSQLITAKAYKKMLEKQEKAPFRVL